MSVCTFLIICGVSEIEVKLKNVPIIYRKKRKKNALEDYILHLLTLGPICFLLNISNYDSIVLQNFI